ncbi:MAG: TonB-dependent receptor [Halioglobus sp.]
MEPTAAKTRIAAAIIALTSQYASAQLEEVVVTAQKRTQSMQDVPVAVSAFGGNDIDTLGWSDPSEVAAQVPNMQMSAPFGDVQPQFSIRGISMIDYTPSQSSPVGVYVDEAYIGSPWLHGLSMYDMERIEVLRGPQGTLYGKNTTGGAINLITRTPGIDDETGGYFKIGAGNYGLVEGNGALEGTLVDGKLSGRVAVNYKDNDGYYENKFPGGDDMNQTSYYALRGTLNFQATDALNAVLKVSYGESDAKSAVSRIVGTQRNGMNLTSGPETLNADYHEGTPDYAGDTTNEMTMVNLKLDWDLGDYSVVSITSWYDGEFFNGQDIDGASDPQFHVDWNGASTALSQDLRLVSNFNGPFNFIAGVYYGDEDVDTIMTHNEFAGAPLDVTNLYIAGQPESLNPLGLNQAPVLLLAGENGGAYGEIHRPFDVVKESWAVYTDINWDMSERWSLNVGLRYTDDKTTRDFINYSRVNGGALALPPALTGAPVWIPVDARTEGTWIGGNEGNVLGIPAPFIPPGTIGPGGTPLAPAWTHAAYTPGSAEELSESEGEVTGTVAVNYQVNDDVMTYLRFSHGYRSGAFNNGLVYADEGSDAYVDPEFVDAWELGMKGEFFDGLMRLNAAAFYYDYKDQQFVNQVGISAILENAGGVDIYGMEFELLTMPAEGLTLQAGLGLIDAEYNELILTTQALPPASGDFKGNEPVSTPDTNFNLAVDYEFDISQNWMARLHLDGNYLSDQWFSAYNGEVVPTLGDYSDLKQEAYWLWNARVAFADNSDTYAISAWVANLADEEYDVYGISLATLGFNSFAMGAPRTYGIDFTYRF